MLFRSGRVDFVAADEDGLLAGREGPVRGGLPFEPQEVCGIEGVLLVNLLVQPLAHAESQVVRELPLDVQVQVVALEMGVIDPVRRLSVEKSRGCLRRPRPHASAGLAGGRRPAGR